MKKIDRRASDNKYLHKDFHISMNMLMGYIAGEYGDAALTEYLQRFASAYHSPLKEALVKKGLGAMEKYLKDIYEKEEWQADISLEDEALYVSQKACPGISHIRSKGFVPARQYSQTYSTVYETVCEGTPFKYELLDFDSETGGCRQVFRRRK